MDEQELLNFLQSDGDEIQTEFEQAIYITSGYFEGVFRLYTLCVADTRLTHLVSLHYDMQSHFTLIFS